MVHQLLPPMISLRKNPSIGVISVGQDNTYNHPNADTIKRLNENKVTIYRTDKDGTVILSSDGSNIIKK